MTNQHNQNFELYGTSRYLSQCRTVVSAVLLAVSALGLASAHAEQPGRGATAEFEKNYLTQIIDHHYSALRITELAAGTDSRRDAMVTNPGEGTSPTPDTTSTPAKAGMADIRSMARMANRMQREEIAKAQKFLQEWYGMTHTPSLSAEGRQQIQLLEQTSAGAQFEQAFLQVFSNHHYAALHPSLDCQIRADTEHHDLMGYCEGIVHNQVREINEMRSMLCEHFAVCDYQPTTGMRMQPTTTTATRQ